MRLVHELLRYATVLVLLSPMHAFASPPQAAVPGQPDPLDVSLHGLDGSVHKVSDWRGKVVLVNYWATWCPPCLSETPLLINLQNKYAAQGFQVVSIDAQEIDEETGTSLPVTDADYQAVRDFLRTTPFLKKHPMSFPIFMADEHVGAMAAGFGASLQGLPVSVLLDGDGHVLSIHTGKLTEGDATVKAIESALSSPAASKRAGAASSKRGIR